MDVIAFSGILFRWEGPAAWTFVEVPSHFGPSRTEAWGRAPAIATVDGVRWKTSVWREKSGRVLLPVPKKVRRGREAGEMVRVELQYPTDG